MTDIDAYSFDIKQRVRRSRTTATGQTTPSKRPRISAKAGESASHEPQVLKPFHRSEAYTIAEAAAWARKAPRTVREWCMRFDIGRRIGGRWMVSRVALQMLLDADWDTLRFYLAGYRHCESVIRYYAQLEIPIPRRAVIGTKLAAAGRE